MGRRFAQRISGLTAPLPDEPDTNAGGPGGSTPPPAEGGGGTVTMTQDQLNRLAAERADRAERDAVRKVAEQLGMSPADAKKKLDEVAEKEQAAKSEEQRRAEQLAAKEREVAEKEAAALAREAELRNRAALVSAGATGDNLEDAVALLARRLPADADEAKVGDTVAELKKSRPELFTAPTSSPAGTPPAAPPKPGATTSTADFGADGLEEAKRRFPDKYATAGAART